MMPSRRMTPRPGVIEWASIPAPLGGLNNVDPASAMPATDAVVLWNAVAAELGMRVRLGTKEWVTGLTGASDNYVRTLIPFSGSSFSGLSDRLFACTSTGIWDVSNSGTTTAAWVGATSYDVGTGVTSHSLTYICKTAGTSAASGGLPSAWAPTTAYATGARVLNNGNAYICTFLGTSAGSGGPTGTGSGIVDGTATWAYQSADSDVTDGTAVWRYSAANTVPSQVIAFGTQTGDAGHGVWTVFVNAAGHFIVYCDEVNGAYLYTESTDTWAQYTAGAGAGQISGVDPADLVYCVVFKNRLWFVERDSGRTWYLAISAISGTATAFDMASKLQHGGSLVGLWNWTVDGGAGIDDLLVGISQGGDVVIWQGTDPASATTFGLKGVWYAGSGLPYGRRIATTHGGDLLILSRLGLIPLSKIVTGAGGSPGAQYETRKVSPLFNAQMLLYSTLHGWSVRLHPEDASLVITVPTAEGSGVNYLVMSLNAGGWSQYRFPSGAQMLCCEAWGGKFYYGTVDGKVGINTGYVDGVTLADPNSYSAITASVITAFQNLGNGRQKQVQMVRPSILCDGGDAAYTIAARYRYDMTEAATPAQGVTGGNVWDSGVWDAATWAGTYQTQQTVVGTTGMGVEMAVAMQLTVSSRTILVGWDLGYTQGGAL